MTVNIIPSIESLAGMKPLAVNKVYNINSLGAWSTTVYTPASDNLYLVTNYIAYFVTGAGTSLYLQARDGNNTPQLITLVMTPTVNYPYTEFLTLVAAEAGHNIEIGMTITTQPCQMLVWLSGFLFKRGQGVLD